MEGTGEEASTVTVRVGNGPLAKFFSRTTKKYSNAAATIIATAKSEAHNQVLDGGVSSTEWRAVDSSSRIWVTFPLRAVQFTLEGV
jgi:hypothetical protein